MKYVKLSYEEFLIAYGTADKVRVKEWVKFIFIPIYYRTYEAIILSHRIDCQLVCIAVKTRQAHSSISLRSIRSVSYKQIIPLACPTQ